MQNLIAKHGKCTVKAGPLSGKNFEDIPKERVLRAAKRYTGDPEFAKFARAYALLTDLQEEDIPEACMPIVPVQQPDNSKKDSSNLSWFWRILSLAQRIWSWSRYGRIILLCFCVALIFRPTFSRLISKLIVTTFRVSLRRILSFCIAVLEGLLDELMYQVEYVMRDAIPAGMSVPEAASATFNWLTHLASSGCGAVLALLVQHRRAQLG